MTPPITIEPADEHQVHVRVDGSPGHIRFWLPECINIAWPGFDPRGVCMLHYPADQRGYNRRQVIPPLLEAVTGDRAGRPPICTRGPETQLKLETEDETTDWDLGKANQIAEDFFLRPPVTHEELYRKYAGTDKASVLQALLTRSLWDVLGDYFDSEKVKCTLARADDCGDPTAVGSLLAEVVESASSGAGVENRSGVVHGGMGMITQALAAAARRFGAQIRTESAVRHVIVEQGKANGVRLESADELRARLVVSNADPKRTFLKLVKPDDLDEGFRRQVQDIKTRAGYMKYLAILTDLPRFAAMPTEFEGDARAVASVRIAPSLAYYQQAWQDAQSGIPARQPVMSLHVPTVYTPEMAPAGKHILGAWVRYAPTVPRDGGWDRWRVRARDGIVQCIDQYAPGFSSLIEWQKLYTTIDIQEQTGITDASIRHVDMSLDQMLHRRPLPAWSSYKTPLEGLWMCGSGTHPCGSVTGAPGHNAAHAILEHLGSGKD